MSKILILGMLCLNLIGSNLALAQEICGSEVKVYKVGGFTLRGVEINVLAGNYFTTYSAQLGERGVVEKLEKMINSVNPNPRGSKNPKELAQKIYDASEAYGVDPIFYGAKIWQESGFFNVDVVAKGGDTGLSQMTGDGLNEITEQYKKYHSKHSEVNIIGKILYKLSMNYFKSKKATANWYNWVLQKTNYQKKQTLVKSVDYALAAGASLFKIYLAEYNGAYKSAISQFNGKGTKNYYGKVEKKSESLKKMSQGCQLSESANELVDAVCEIVGSEEECNFIVNEMWNDNVKTYDI